jgi:hypothetical protein
MNAPKAIPSSIKPSPYGVNPAVAAYAESIEVALNAQEESPNQKHAFSGAELARPEAEARPASAHRANGVAASGSTPTVVVEKDTPQTARWNLRTESTTPEQSRSPEMSKAAIPEQYPRVEIMDRKDNGLTSLKPSEKAEVF